MASTSDYTNLITSEHADKPNFVAAVAAMTQGLVDVINASNTLALAFDVDTAEGSQLDAIGRWVGLSRNILAPIAAYFAFDDAALGFDLGSWQGPYDPSEGIVSLDDETYRSMLRVKIASNHWDGTAGSFATIIQSLLQPGTFAFVSDNFDMTMTVTITGNLLPALLKGLILNGYLKLKPEGVQVTYLINTAGSGSAPIFAFDVNNVFYGGFDTGYWI